MTKEQKRKTKRSLALLALAAMNACATLDNEHVGVTSQASSLSPALNPGLDLQFPGELAITANKGLSIGGYNKAGTAQTTSGVVDPSLASGPPDLRWQTLSAALPTALGEVAIVELAANTYLVATGRASRDGMAVANAWILELSGLTATWNPITSLAQARVGFDGFKPCGLASNNHWIAFGGFTNKGMRDFSTGVAVTNSIEVFTFTPRNGLTPPSGSWSTLKDSGGNVVTLQKARGYHIVLPISTTNFRVLGGDDAVNNAIKKGEKLIVDNTCTATNATTVGGVKVLPFITDMPAERARMSWAQSNVTVGGTTYDYAIATGNNTTLFGTPPTAIFLYDSTNDAYNSSKALNTGRVFGRLVVSGTAVQVATGVIPKAMSSEMFDHTTTSVDSISSTGVVSASTALATDRVGSLVQLLNSLDIAAFGTQYTTGTPPTSTAAGDVESF
jgi:hypothetical protein